MLVLMYWLILQGQLSSAAVSLAVQVIFSIIFKPLLPPRSSPWPTTSSSLGLGGGLGESRKRENHEV